MTLLELVKHLRQSILDDIGGSGVDWENITEDDDEVVQLRWTNEELTRFINEAEKKACRNALLLKSNDSSFDISVTAGTATYSIDPNIIRIKGIYLSSTGKELKKAEYEQVMGIKNWRSDTGTPEYFIGDMNSGTITLYKNPVVDDTIYILAHHLPLTSMSWDSNDSDTPSIREEHQIPMLDWAAHLAYQKEEANTLDPTKSEYHRQKFEREFPDTSAYSETRRNRTAYRPVSYGGL